MSALADQQAVQKKWIHRDNVRGWAAVGISLPVQLLLTVLGVDYLTSLFVFWVIYGIVYAALTLSAFRRVDPADLPGLLRSEAQRTWWIRFLLGGGDGPGFAVTLAAVALGGAALLPRLGSFASGTNEIVLAVVLVAAVIISWYVVVLSYSVHYARKDAEHGGLRFPDEGKHGFADYFYFSLTVATTFGATDVSVTTTRMRRTVAGHSALTFLFNTVIIALLVSALAR